MTYLQNALQLLIHATLIECRIHDLSKPPRRMTAAGTWELQYMQLVYVPDNISVRPHTPLPECLGGGTFV